jgi:hypothetical protein
MSNSPPTISANTQLQLSQQPQYKEPLNSDVDASPPLSDSSRRSSLAQVHSSFSSSSATPPTVPRQDFQFHSHANPLGMCHPSPFNTSCPPNTFEPGIPLDDVTALSADSASFHGMGVCTFDQFQNSIPYSGAYDFNHQVPLNFEFSSNTAPYCPSIANPNSSVFGASSLDPTPPPETLSDTFNPAVYPSSSIAAHNGSSAFQNALHMAPMANWSTSTNTSVMNMACDVSSSNSDQVQNMFQQFI